jgi:hypothetical protein
VIVHLHARETLVEDLRQMLAGELDMAIGRESLDRCSPTNTEIPMSAVRCKKLNLSENPFENES